MFGSARNHSERQSMMGPLSATARPESNLTLAAPTGPDFFLPPCGTRARRRRAVPPEAAHFPTKGFIMKHSLILLALASTFALSACQRPAAAPPVVQVIAGPAGAPGATG